jgi:membrane protease YdiL (CAAX protease family)
MADSRLPRTRTLALLTVAGLALIAYTYLTPPLAPPGLAARLPGIGALPGDLPLYAWRFLLSFLLLGALPFTAALVLGERPAGLGLVRPRTLAPRWLFPLLLGVVILGALIGAYNAPIFAYYPYSRTLTESLPGGAIGFLLHAVLYTLLYYLPWEVLFRGILIFPLVRLAAAAGPAGSRSDSRGPAALFLMIACLQALPSTLLHFGHPWSETLMALPFGLALGWLALATGSLLPGLALHAAAGLFLDLFILLRRAGSLP